MNIMTNVNVFVKLFIEYLQIEMNYSKYTIEHYHLDFSKISFFTVEVTYI